MAFRGNECHCTICRVTVIGKTCSRIKHACVNDVSQSSSGVALIIFNMALPEKQVLRNETVFTCQFEVTLSMILRHVREWVRVMCMRVCLKTIISKCWQITCKCNINILSVCSTSKIITLSRQILFFNVCQTCTQFHDICCLVPQKNNVRFSSWAMKMCRRQFPGDLVLTFAVHRSYESRTVQF